MTVGQPGDNERPGDIVTVTVLQCNKPSDSATGTVLQCDRHGDSAIDLVKLQETW